MPRPENYDYFPQYFNDLETYLGTKLSSTRKKEEEQRYQKSWINRWQNYGKAMRTMKNPVRRKNQQSIYDRTAERRAEGQRRAKTTEPAIYAQWRKQDRYQASHFLWNMIKALKISPWQNTIDDWQRYFEAKYILKLRKSRR